MKLNIFVGSLVLGASLCGQSFGGGLLDRLLSLKGAGCDTSCCDTTPACDPGCGVENACDPGCGIENACDPGCGIENGNGNGCDPACGVENGCTAGCAAPSCGTETACCTPKRKPLLSLLHSLKPKKLGCDNGCAADPGCGIENACDPGCGIENGGCAAGPACGPDCGIEVASCDNGCDSGCKIKRPRLLDLLFKCKSKGCDEVSCDAISACGCGAAPAAAPAAPAAPAASEAAPMPPAPVVDPSAYLQSKRRVIQASSYVR